jgi:hypothetical protein
MIVVKSPVSSLDQLFQYDVMKLLHSAIIYSEKSSGVLNRSGSSE